MKKFLIVSVCVALLAAGCKKTETSVTSDIPAITTEGATATQENVLRDFTDVLAVPNYVDLQAKASLLNQAVLTLNGSVTDANLAAAQTAWRNVRVPWEACEGYLFGPVEDLAYDPTMDTWPLDRTQLDSLLASSNNLTVPDIDHLSESLKGFHAIEYVLFGVGGQQKAANITPRQLTYVVSLSQSLYNTTTELRDSWDTTRTGSYGIAVKTAGAGSTVFNTRRAAFQTIITAMAGICGEVGTGKMQDPLGQNGQADSTLDESSFSHNSTTDFTNNIKGIKNAYFCTYNGVAGHSLHELVAASNKSLDNKITSAIYDAIASFNTIDQHYEIAIYTQRGQIQAVQAKLATLESLLANDLQAWALQYTN